MLPPVRALGSEYVGVQYRPRTGEPAIWRVVGAVDGTSLTFSPSIPAGSGTRRRRRRSNQGQMVEFATATPFVVKSQDDQHPFMLFEYMSGSRLDRSMVRRASGYGDPDFSVQVPPQQYLVALRLHDRPDLPRDEPRRHPAARREQQLPGRDDRLRWHVPHPPAGRRSALPVHAPRPADRRLQGRRTAARTGATSSRATRRSACAVWGWGTPNTSPFTANVSYSYPGGMNVQPINTVVIPPTPH